LPNTLQEITQKALLGLGGKIIRLLLNFVTAVVLGRLYGAHFMGIYFLFVSLVTILGVPVKLGMHRGILKAVNLLEMQQRQNQAGSFLRFAGFISLLLWLLLTSLLTVFRETLTYNLFHLKIATEVWVAAISVAVLVVVMFEHLRGFFLALGKIQEVVWAEFIIQPLTICLLFVLLTGFGKMPILTVPTVYILSFGMALSYLLCKLKRLLPGPWLPLHYTVRKAFLKLSVPLCLTGIVYLIMHWTDSIFVGYFHSTFEVGIYNAASRIAAFLPFLMVSFNLILPALIVRMHHTGQTLEMLAMVRKITRWNLLFALLGYSSFIIFRLEIVTIFGPEFIPAELPLLLLGGAQIFNVAAGPTATVLIMTGHERPVLKASVIAGICNILLDLVLIPRLGIVGAAAATGISLALQNLFLIWICRHHLESSPHAERAVELIVSFAATSLILVWGHGKIGTMALMLVYVFSMTFLTWIWLGRNDLNLLRQTLMEITKKVG